jgi:hypothetical protein
VEKALEKMLVIGTASDNNYVNGPANAITLSTYTTAVNANERSCIFRIRQSYYWNVIVHSTTVQ